MSEFFPCKALKSNRMAEACGSRTHLTPLDATLDLKSRGATGPHSLPPEPEALYYIEEG